MNIESRKNIEEVLNWGKPKYIPALLPVDVIMVNDNHFTNYTGNNKWQDPWGVVWKKDSDGGYHYPVSPSVQSIDDALSLKFPDPKSEELTKPALSSAKLHTEEKGFLLANHEDFFFSRMWQLLGMENCLVYLISEKEKIKQLAHRIMVYNIEVAKFYAELGVEIVRLTDDLGAQNSMYFRPSLWREIFKPELKRIIDFYRKKNIRILFHSCGHIEEIVPDLVQLGIDILNPVQARANNLDKIREITNKKVTLYGGIDTQDLLSFGTPERIRKEVRLLLWKLGRNGGWIASPDQLIQLPDENEKAMIEIIEQWGEYPITAR